MNTIDQTTLHQWLDWDADGELGAAEKAQLEAHLAQNPGLRAEKARLHDLHQGMVENRVSVAPEFKEQVMRSLPTAPWEKKKSAWHLPLAVMLFSAIGAAFLLAGSIVDNPVVGTGLAVVDFLQVSALAGAGLLTASWRGAGMALEELFTGFDPAFFALMALVVFLNLLFFSMLRRRSSRDKAEATVTVDRESN